MKREAKDVVDGSEEWYDKVYGENDTIYNLIIKVDVKYDESNPVLTGSQSVENGVNYYYYQDMRMQATVKELKIILAITMRI